MDVAQYNKLLLLLFMFYSAFFWIFFIVFLLSMFVCFLRLGALMYSMMSDSKLHKTTW